jgi:hypothetical protein
MPQRIRETIRALTLEQGMEVLVRRSCHASYYVIGARVSNPKLARSLCAPDTVLVRNNGDNWSGRSVEVARSQFSRQRYGRDTYLKGGQPHSFVTCSSPSRPRKKCAMVRALVLNHTFHHDHAGGHSRRPIPPACAW